VELAEALAHRNDQYRTRISQLMLLGEMVLSPIPAEVSDRVNRSIDELRYRITSCVLLGRTPPSPSGLQ
jgi:hypothetical protein